MDSKLNNLMKPSLYADVDECELDTDNCHVNATCTDVIGSFECECYSGFEGNGVNCRQVNKDITGALFVWIDGLVTSIQVAPCP